MRIVVRSYGTAMPIDPGLSGRSDISASMRRPEAGPNGFLADTRLDLLRLAALAKPTGDGFLSA
jgi:hypothetical protein